ncbi:leucine-rich repeat protein kinase family protein [Striga asiatica]|uniref:Leucine-rich repeat protein kinase family protein n=1 Tax=Striga asiatica TaxID=4170 RepID=A0A5A7QJQ0_STRAF|nr:leucine-rich repeat protein kinase family protein [Striga asiatica]
MRMCVLLLPPPMLLLLLFSLLPAALAADLSSDRAALLSLRSALGGRPLLWNDTSPTPCAWQGVRCDGDRVVALRLPASSLSGALPANTISNLTSLRTLSLRLNHLSGPLPDDLSRLSQLRNLYLQGNQFTGPLPDSVLSLHALVRLNLASNNFSGEIPRGLGNLTRLRTLYLEENQFDGPLPDIELQNLDQFNVSFNNLNGSVPKGLVGKPKDAFMGTSLCGQPLDRICAGNAGPTESPAEAPNGNIDLGGKTGKKKKLSGGAIAGIVVGSFVGLILLVLALFILCRKRKGNNVRSVDVTAIKNHTDEPHEKPIEETNGGVSNGFSVSASAVSAMGANGNTRGEMGTNSAANVKKLVFFGNASRIFDLEELLRASAEVLGKGTFGTSYKAVLEVGTVVAVKRLKDVTIGEREFREKIEAVGAMDHENLVPLRAYYYSREEKLLVFDYMPMGSLSALLHGNKGSGKNPLNWETRLAIALGAAHGIEYLHSQGPTVSHGNIKSSNILLTKSHKASVSDFGLNKLVGPPSSPTRVAGYRAPEVTEAQRVSQKADVYSFGVLLLELLTGKAPAHSLLNEEGVDLPRWVQSVVRDEWTSEVFDVELVRYNSLEEEMVQLLQLGIGCTAQYPDSRPSISEVVKRIEGIQVSSLRGYQDETDRLQKLRQGPRSIDEYMKDFYRLLTRVEVRETKGQLVSRYVGDMSIVIQDVLNLFVPDSVSDTYQQDIIVEKQLARKTGPSFASSSQSDAAVGAASAGVQSGRGAPAAGMSSGSALTMGCGATASGGLPRSHDEMGQAAAAGVQRAGGRIQCFRCDELGGLSTRVWDACFIRRGISGIFCSRGI